MRGESRVGPVEEESGAESGGEGAEAVFYLGGENPNADIKEEGF